MPAWAIVNTRSSVDPFLTFSTVPRPSRTVWRKFKSRGDNGDANDTKATIAAIVRLRAERARLLGFESHAHWRMQDTMAVDPATAQSFLLKVWPAVVARVKREVADMQATCGPRAAGHARSSPGTICISPRRCARRNTISTKPRSSRTCSSTTWWRRRCGLRSGVLASHSEKSPEPCPCFIPRCASGKSPTRAPGDIAPCSIWITSRAQGRNRARGRRATGSQHAMDEPVTSIASNNNNFVKGAPGEPVLISIADATTLFHEFGHALHSMLQNVRYRSLAMTPRDYVELPSQLNERWLLNRELLDRFARHYETGEPMPQSLVDKIEQSGKFNQGYATLEYLSAAIVDMDLHTRPDGVEDMAAFEREALARIGGMPREVVMRHRLPHFDHLFGNDSYSAGYYSYLWSDVMAADAWQAFVEAGGPWDADVNERLRTHILSDGNSIDRAEAYRRFRGRDPEVQALLDARGFTAVESVRPLPVY